MSLSANKANNHLAAFYGTLAIDQPVRDVTVDGVHQVVDRAAGAIHVGPGFLPE